MGGVLDRCQLARAKGGSVDATCFRRTSRVLRRYNHAGIRETPAAKEDKETPAAKEDAGGEEGNEEDEGVCCF